MFSSWQTPASLVLVAIALGYVVRRTVLRRRRPGCGGGGCCPTDAFKAKLKR